MYSGCILRCKSLAASEELLAYIIIGCVVLAVIATVVRLALLGWGIAALRDFLKRRRR